MTLSTHFRRGLAEYWLHVRAFSPDARLFLGAAALGGISGGVTNLLLNLYILALGYPEGALPSFTRFGLAGAALGAVTGGPLVDLLRPKRSMLVGTALAAAGVVLVLAGPRSLVLGAGVFLSSVGSVLVYIAAPTFLARHSTPRERPYLFGVTAAAYVVSTAAGAVIGGALPALMRSALPALSDAPIYRLSLLAGGLFSALGIPLLLLVRESPPQLADQAPNHGETGEGDALGGGVPGLGVVLRDLRERLLDRRFALLVAQFVVADGLIRVGGNLVIPYFNVYFVRHLGAPEPMYGGLRFGERALVVLATLGVAVLVRRFGPVVTVVVTQLLSVPMLLVLGFAPTLGVAAAAFLVRGPLMEMTQPTRDNFLMDVVPEGARATAFAALTLAGYAIGFAASYPAERLLRAEQFHIAFVATAVLYVASAALYWAFFRRAPAAQPTRPAAALPEAPSGAQPPVPSAVLG